MSSNNLTKFALAIVLVDRAGRVLPVVDDVACVEVVIVVASMPESGSVKVVRRININLDLKQLDIEHRTYLHLQDLFSVSSSPVRFEIL